MSKGYINNRFKKRDDSSDLNPSYKRDAEAQIGELFFSREVGQLSFKKGVNDFVRYSEGGGANLPYKVFTALLTQEGTEPPVARILENTLEVEVNFEFGSDGIYTAIFDKTLFLSPQAYVTMSNPTFVKMSADVMKQCVVQAVPVFFNAVSITSAEIGSGYANDIIGTALAPNILEIRVYNDEII
jgi:hypothetical protein